MLLIKEILTKINRTIKKWRKIKGIVIHWVGCITDKNLIDGDCTAEKNAEYFENVNRGASAHYFVDNDSIVQSVMDKDIAWHCGTKGSYFHPYLRNSNTLGIELGLNPDGTISQQTLKNAKDLVQIKMKEYGIEPKDIVRHYDVTHKLCPAPYVDGKVWNDVHTFLTTDSSIINNANDVNPYKEPTKVLKYNKLMQYVAQESVKWLQWELAKAGFDITVDGKFGLHTLSCLEVFQAKYPETYAPKKAPDGVCGEITRKYLKLAV